MTIGTSAAVRKVSETTVFDRQKQNFCYYLQDDLYVVGAPSNNGGCVLAWAKRPYQKILMRFIIICLKSWRSRRSAVTAYVFSLFKRGAGTFWTNEITGGFSGLTLKHNRSDMLRAVIEGMLMNIDLLKQMAQLEGAVTVSGGFFQTKLLGQMTADVLGLTCYLSDENEPIFGLYDLYKSSVVRQDQPDENLFLIRRTKRSIKNWQKPIFKHSKTSNPLGLLVFFSTWVKASTIYSINKSSLPKKLVY